MFKYVTNLNIHIRTHVAGIVKIKPEKKVNNAITPLTNIAVRIRIMLEPMILKKFLIDTGKLFRNVANAFESFETIAPVKWANKVKCVAFKISNTSERIAKPTMAIKTESAIKIYAIIKSKSTAKNGNENKRDTKPNWIDFKRCLT